MMITRIAALVAAGSLSVGCLSARPAPPNAPQARAPEERHVYRLDFVVAANDPGKPAQTSAYTLNLEEHDSGELHMGTNIALSSQSRQDVGLKIRAHLDSMGDELIMRDQIEMSGVDETTPPAPTSIHKVTTMGDAVLHAGQSALIASLEDPLSHKHYRVSATATRLR